MDPGVAADEVVQPGLDLRPVAGEPGLSGLMAGGVEDLLGAPALALPAEVVAAPHAPRGAAAPGAEADCVAMGISPRHVRSSFRAVAARERAPAFRGAAMAPRAPRWTPGGRELRPRSLGLRRRPDARRRGAADLGLAPSPLPPQDGAGRPRHPPGGTARALEARRGEPRGPAPRRLHPGRRSAPGHPGRPRGRAAGERAAPRRPPPRPRRRRAAGGGRGSRGPNGIAFDAGGRRPRVAETGDRTRGDPERLTRAFDPEDGWITGGDTLRTIEPGRCDGPAEDEAGFARWNAADGVRRSDPGGGLADEIIVPARVSNPCASGAHPARRFICGAPADAGALRPRRRVRSTRTSRRRPRGAGVPHRAFHRRGTRAIDPGDASRQSPLRADLAHRARGWRRDRRRGDGRRGEPRALPRPHGRGFGAWWRTSSSSSSRW